MKNFLLVAFAIFPLLASAADPQVFSGSSRRTGQPYLCASVPAPSETEAQADADKQASDYCAMTNAKAERVSEFSISVNNCVWGGPQYKIPSDTLYAQASYVCTAAQPSPPNNGGTCQHQDGPNKPLPECAPHAFGCCGGCWCN